MYTYFASSIYFYILLNILKIYNIRRSVNDSLVKVLNVFTSHYRCTRSCRWILSRLYRRILSHFNRAVHRDGDGSNDRTSFHVSNGRRTGNQYIGPRRRVWGARQTQKLVFRKLVSVINNELSIYFTRGRCVAIPPVYRGVRKDSNVAFITFIAKAHAFDHFKLHVNYSIEHEHSYHSFLVPSYNRYILGNLLKCVVCAHLS